MPDCPNFPLGALYVTKAACEVLASSDVTEALARHAWGERGDVSPEDARANALALSESGRLLFSYKSAEGHAFWVVTETFRSATVVLLPSDYSTLR